MEDGVVDGPGRHDDALVEYLHTLGATDEEIARDRDASRLLALAIQLVMAPEARLTASGVVERSGVARDEVLRLWRAWGITPPSDDDARFGADDVTLTQLSQAIVGIMGDEAAYHTARVMGSAMARVAEAEIAMLRNVLEAPLRASGADEATVARAYADLVPAMLRQADDTLRLLHRHHLVEQGRRQAVSNPKGEAVFELGVAFADITGSTRLALASEPEALDLAIAEFEARSAHQLADLGLSLVKFLGDGVMFTGGDVAALIAGAKTLVDQFRDDPLVPPVRASVAFGPVVARRGDYYGVPVILASRLLGAARPATVVLPADLAGHASDHAPRPLGPVTLSGFAEPVDIHEIS